ncbi:MAG: 4Fe-4S binding protein, partial [Phycisphaerae bacterium]|nr:4Fe-4S binding protein [Phycisphaerae bacterium]
MRFHWFLSSRTKDGKPRRLRILKALGDTWHASPVRRTIQAMALLVFLGLFFYAAWPTASGDFAAARDHREKIDIETFLALDPLVSVSSAIASRAWVWSLKFAAVLLALSLVAPRMFCGYLCPMGTIIDLFDWSVTTRVKRFRVLRAGWWRNLRFYLLATVLAGAIGGIMLSGFISAIPVVTRGFQFIASPLQLKLLHRAAPPITAGQIVSIGLFALVLLLGFMRPRFWCRHVCPSGALFSVFSFFRLTERKVSSDCIQCGRCHRVCSFGAINDDYSTHTANCTFCQTCGGVCPVGAIGFTHRLAGDSRQEEPAAIAPPTDVSRRGFMIGVAVGAVGGGLAASGLRPTRAKLTPVLRPP